MNQSERGTRWHGRSRRPGALYRGSSGVSGRFGDDGHVSGDSPGSDNDHLALIYEDRERQLSTAVSFVREGLDAGEKGLYVADDNTREAVRAEMYAQGIDVDAALDSGALAIHGPEDTYLETDEFDRDAMLAFWEDTLETAKDDGYEGIRAAAEMTWALDDTNHDLLAEYEAMLNVVYEDEEYAVLCQYNRERFPAETIREVIRAHPHLVHGDTVGDNVYYQPPQEFFAPERPGREVDRMLTAIQERADARTDFVQLFENSHDAVFLLDVAEEEILEFNGTACEMLGYTREELHALDFADLHPDDLPEFRAFLQNAVEEGSAWSDEFACRDSDGRDIPGEFSVTRLTSADQPIVLVSVRDYSELQRREQYLRELYEIVADADRTFEQKLRALFELGCERFELDLGGMARIDLEADHFEVKHISGHHDYLQPGAQVALSETYCRVHDRVGEPTGITNPLSQGFEETMAYTEFGVKSYLGTRIELENGLDRTLFFVSTDPKEQPFSETERTFLHLMGEWMSHELDRQRTLDELAALDNLNEAVRDVNRALVQQSTRDRIERTVCERLTASDSYQSACIGTVDAETGEVVPSTGELSTDWSTVPTEDGRNPFVTARRTGEPELVQPIDGAPGNASETIRQIVIPIAYEDQSYGVLSVSTSRENAFSGTERAVISQLGEITGLAIAAVEREQQLEHERERLEFVNRLIRHNLLNGLNVVQAHTTLLEPSVDTTGEEYLETIRGRTDDMNTLLQTLRSLMKAILEEDEHRLKPIDLEPVLRRELEQLEHQFDHAEIEVTESLADAGFVLADDLLGEAFENLLVNAVQHNDQEIPRVEVDVEGGAQTVTIRISDNGPGIPDEMRDNIFKKGEKDFASPGTGFGLYLVQEIIDVYGGTVDIDDDDSSGAVFSVTLPRP